VSTATGTADDLVVEPAHDKPAPVTEAAPRAWYTVAMLAVVIMLAQVDRNVISLMVESIKDDFDLSDTEIGYLTGIAFVSTYFLLGPPIARVADRGFRKPVVCASLAIWSFATSLCGLAQNYWQLFVGRMIVGGAESGSSPASLSMIADVIPKAKLPRAYAIYNTGFMAGGAAALFFGGLLMGAFADMEPIPIPGIGVLRDWQMVFIILGLPGLLVALIIMLTVPEPKRTAMHKKGGYPLSEVFGFMWANRRMHIPLLLGSLLNSIQSFGSIAWIPAFYERTSGGGPAVAGPLLGPINMASSLLGLFGGAWLAERLAKSRDDANVRTMFLANLLCIPFIVISPLMPTPWLALTIGAIGGSIAAMGGAGYNAALQISTPNAMRGQINAIYLFVIAAVGGGIGPLLVGLLTDFVAGAEEDLRYVLAGYRLALAPIDALLVWLAVRPYGKAVRDRIDAGE
jgi:MFS family permease